MSTFPLLRGIFSTNRLGFVEPESESHGANMETRARFIGTVISRDSPSLWSLESFAAQMFHDLPMAQSIMESIWEVPMAPPFDVIWFEYSVGPKLFGCLAIKMAIEGDGENYALNLHPIRMQRGHRSALVLPGTANLTIAPNGEVKAFQLLDDLYREISPIPPDPDGDNVSDDLKLIWNTVMFVITAIGMSNCKNVELVERLPKRHEQREAKRKGEPILKYHEIVIDPGKTKQVAIGAGSAAQDHPSRALHIARGHFATYTEDKPLFGKYTGTFWRPAHVRGSAELGAVKSSYKVKAGHI